MKWYTETIEQFEDAIKQIVKIISDDHQKTKQHKACIVCFQGDLGAGKTTATQVIARFLGIDYTIQSPTFVIRKSYSIQDSIFKTLIHMDAYRLEGEQNLEALRLGDDFETPHALMIIEWPEIIREHIPSRAITVNIDYADTGRIITLSEIKKQAD